MKFGLGSIVGLDIGTYAVKVAEMKRGLREIELLNYYETPFLKNENGENLVSDTIKTLFSQRKLYGKSVIASFPDDRTTFRNLTFPFSDTKKIDSIFKYEVEGLLSLQPEEVIADYVTLASDKEKTSILCVITDKDSIKQQLQILQEAGIDPDCLDLGLLALANSARFSFGNATQECSLILEIGATTTSAVIFNPGGGLNLVRSIPFGGNDIVKNCAEKMGSVSQEELEKQKIKGERIIEPGWEEPVLKVLFQDLKKIVTAFSQDNENSIERVYLCGGGTVTGLRNILSERLGIEVVRWNPLEGINFHRAGVPKGREYAAAGVFGLGLRHAKGHFFSLDLRKEEFAKKNLLKGLTDNLITSAILLGIFVIIFTGNLFNKNWSLEEEYQLLKNRGRQLYRETIPGKGKIVNEVVQLKEKIRIIKQEYQTLGGDDFTKGSPLDLLRKITLAFPDDKDTEIYHYSFSGEEMRLEGEASSLDTIDLIKSRLSAIKEIQNIKITDTKLGGDKESVKFKIILFL